MQQAEEKREPLMNDYPHLLAGSEMLHHVYV